MSYYGGTVTVKGRNLLASLMGGETISLTKILVGSGALPEGVDPIDMEDLVYPVALATSSVPIVEDNVLSMIVEYRNDLNGGLTQGFWLREFGVYAKTDKQDEVLLYYATLGDSPQPVNAYKDNRIDTRRYPIQIALTLDANVVVEYNPGSFVTSDDANELLDHLVKEHLSNVKISDIIDITIPSSGWAPSSEQPEIPSKFASEYKVYLDIPNAAIIPDLKPELTIHPDSWMTSFTCGFFPAAETIAGALRVFAVMEPTAPMTATLELRGGTGFFGSGDGTATELQPATKYSLGGVKIGSGLSVTADGTVSVNAASAEETRAALSEILSGE